MMWSRSLVLTAVVALGLTGAAAWGQNQLPSGVIMAPGVLSAAQQTDVTNYVDAEVQVLASAKEGDEEKVAQARQRLIDPLRKGGTPGFNSFYSATVSARLKNLLGAGGSGLPIVRLNAMIVAANLVDAGALDLIEQGLKDTNAAVRYWAAVALEQWIKRGPLDGRKEPFDADQRRLMVVLAVVAPKEQWPHVLRRFLVAYAALTVPEATPGLLKLLNERVAIHAGDPQLPLTPETEALKVVVRKIIDGRSNKLVSDDIIRQVALVIYRYAALATAVLEADPTAGRIDLEAFDLADKDLPWCFQQFNRDITGLPAAMMPLANSKPPDVVQVRKILNVWKALLENPQGLFKFSAEETDVPALTAPAPTPPPAAAPTTAPAAAPAATPAVPATPATPPAGPARPGRRPPPGGPAPAPAPPAP